MKKLGLLVLLLLITVVLAGIYRFNVTNDDIYVEQSDGQVVKYDAIDNKKVMLTLFGVETDNQWRITLPHSYQAQSQVAVTLTDIRQDSVPPVAIGNYRDGEEVGQVAVDYSKITPLNLSNRDDQMVFVVPFTVSNQGSGVFYYLGLFNLNTKQWRMEQLDTLFIGDRVVIESLATDEPFDVSSRLSLRYLEHGEGQSMAERANKTVDQFIKVTATSLTMADH